MDVPVAKKKNRLLNKKSLLWLSLAVVIAILASIPMIQGAALPSVAQGDVWPGQVKRGELKQQVLGVGELAPKEVRWIVATSPGTLEKLNIKPGARVNKDSIIALIRLYLCKQIAENHNGSLTLSNRRDAKGCIVSFWIPGFDMQSG